MKGLVLSGGVGSRLRPFTYTNAKQLVPIANKPVIFYTIEQLVECGITEVGVVVGDTAAQVQESIGDGSQFGAEVTYIQQDAPKGIAHAVATARDFLGDAPFVLYLGDNFVLGGIKPYVEQYRSGKKGSQILLHPVPNPQDFGIAELTANGDVSRIVEKPKEPATNLAVIGVYIFAPAVHDVIATLKPSWRNELEITDAIQGLIDRGAGVHAEVMDRYWIDTGKMDDILNANRMVLTTLEGRCDGSIDEATTVEGVVAIEAGARVENCTLRGPLIIGQDTDLVDSEIGPNVAIDRACRVKGCRIEDSIVMENSRIEDIEWPIKNSMIGRNVEMAGGHGADGGYKLTLGDHSRIEMPDG
ncbi:MAG TPA: glucose-1-phosphate thymidylyltransferase [Dehalococcoidia bacterium]|nr:glucose-1-phosphate thymidylyltransferase [Dehalococcoidia bacterium]